MEIITCILIYLIANRTLRYLNINLKLRFIMLYIMAAKVAKTTYAVCNNHELQK